jgi:hypothetical protein
MKQKIKNEQLYDSDAKKMLKTFIFVAIIFIVLYFLTALITGEISFSNFSNKEAREKVTTIQYKEILAGEVFNKADKEYYVIFYDFKTNEGKIDGLIQTYEQKTDHLKIYTVNLNNYFNKAVISSDSNPLANNSLDLKIKADTLIKIKNKTNSLYVEGLINIKNYLEQ